MGTNFYWTEPGEPHCASCECYESLHIGKSSGGWCFSLSTHPDEGICSLEDWKQKWTTGTIKDEYGTTLSPDEMADRIEREISLVIDNNQDGCGAQCSCPSFKVR